MTDIPSDAPAPPVTNAADESNSNQADVERLAERVVDPDFEQLVGAVVAQTFAEIQDPLQSMRAVTESMTRYLRNANAASLLFSLLAYWDDESYVDSIMEPLDDGALQQRLTPVLTRLATRYGRQIRTRYDLTIRDPKDWQYIDIRTLYELERSQWIVEVSLQSFDKETIKIVGPPLSFLRLVNKMIELLLNLQPVRDGDSRSEFDDDAIATFLDSAGQLAQELGDGSGVPAPSAETGDLVLPAQHSVPAETGDSARAQADEPVSTLSTSTAHRIEPG